MLFEMIKLQVKGITISHSSYKKRLKGREENNTEEQTAKLQKALDENPTKGVREETENKKQQLNIREIKLKSSMIRSRANGIYEVKKIQNTSNISSSVCSNGHIPEFFKISRGIRQGDPLSPYLFLIVGEVLYRVADRNKKIIGINIDSHTFIMNQLADNTCMLLDGTEESLKARLDLYNDFSKCSGLRINLSKTKTIWIGSKTKSLEILLAGEQLTWLLQDEELSYLGQIFPTSLDKILTSNYDPVISAINKLLAGWEKNRISTIMGKIQVIKSLAIPKLVHLLMSLPSPTPDMINHWNKIFYAFIWDGIPDKISRSEKITQQVA